MFGLKCVGIDPVPLQTKMQQAGNLRNYGDLVTLFWIHAIGANDGPEHWQTTFLAEVFVLALAGDVFPGRRSTVLAGVQALEYPVWAEQQVSGLWGHLPGSTIFEGQPTEGTPKMWPDQLHQLLSCAAPG